MLATSSIPASSRHYEGSSGERANIWDPVIAEHPPRAYESVSAPPTAMLNTVVDHDNARQLETFYPGARLTQARSNIGTMEPPVYSASTQFIRPRTSHDGQTWRGAPHTYQVPERHHPYHPPVVHSPQASTSSYLPESARGSSRISDSLNRQHDSRHSSARPLHQGEHIHGRALDVDLERRCEEIATNCREILQNLEGTEDTRQHRRRRLVRASLEIVEQLQYLVNLSTPSRHPAGPSQGTVLSQTPTIRSSLDFTSHLDVVARFEQMNPEAAEQAARDMAAIRARTHGTFPKQAEEESKKEKDK
ncbi:hypothetical protein QFC19_002562 [Naganishia cerealis]|uniref:Uncharacterized protein n=1 Tax=Naganishia cerealis TaxID=610337 RepID=A0ACC2W8X6_9TREE|nr:hypothetical protein QFC19_002562 [Naganishia cerealis]